MNCLTEGCAGACDEYAALCKPCYKRAWYQRNKERILAIRERHYLENKEEVKERVRQYRVSHREKTNGHRCNRKRQQRLATPPWANRAELRRFYDERPPGMQVDHIVPVMGRDVCGLHVLWNLRYVTPEENSKKGVRLV